MATYYLEHGKGDYQKVVIKETSTNKIDKAFNIIDKAIAGSIPFNYRNYYPDAFHTNGVTAYKDSLKIIARNYRAIKRACTLLFTEGYIISYTLLSTGYLSVKWFNRYVANDLEVVKPILRTKDALDISGPQLEEGQELDNSTESLWPEYSYYVSIRERKQEEQRETQKRIQIELENEWRIEELDRQVKTIKAVKTGKQNYQEVF